jgi:hypothetical protein
LSAYVGLRLPVVIKLPGAPAISPRPLNVLNPDVRGVIFLLRAEDSGQCSSGQISLMQT